MISPKIAQAPSSEILMNLLKVMKMKNLKTLFCAAVLLSAFGAQAGVAIDAKVCKTDPDTVLRAMTQNGVPLINIQSTESLGEDLLVIPIVDAAESLRNTSTEKMAPFQNGFPLAKLIQVIDIYETAVQHLDYRNMKSRDQIAIHIPMTILERSLKLAKESLLIVEAQLSTEPEKKAEIEPLISATVQDLTEFKKSYREMKTQMALSEISMTKKEQLHAARVSAQVSKSMNVEICEKAAEKFAQ
jgi:hypothetical protein